MVQLFQGCTEEGKTPFSFEFFPPKTPAGWEKLYATITQLLPLRPAYVSVTYGAGGGTRDNTHELVRRLNDQGVPVVAHLTCEGSSEPEIREILETYDREGIHNILALKGDVPMDRRTPGPSFEYAADLVSYIRRRFPHFGIGVAGFPEGHPDCPNRLQEMDYLKAKVDAGADYVVTQLFFDNRDFYDFRDRAELAGIQVPIIAGIMPITTRKGMARMAELAGGARFPAKLLKAVGRAADEQGVARVGAHWATEQISDLLANHVAGVHLYTLNTSTSSLEILKNLGLTSYSIKSDV
ncbi:5,10-methylenetetrahydrofolate reductase [Spirochaeta lutea]|uniref:Methylenetetrahydrofolate reductase n=1 Tax=Spirochaeta lutea TaxID=1480694 RepID=A0A098QYK2_9SPIO|nr:5,10-methylenetetrahydrofolate reductase [Spirochaeta lutea]